MLSFVKGPDKVELENQVSWSEALCFLGIHRSLLD